MSTGFADGKFRLCWLLSNVSFVRNEMWNIKNNMDNVIEFFVTWFFYVSIWGKMF